MCSIIAARTIEKFIELYHLNSYRGTQSYSYVEFDRNYNVSYRERHLGEIINNDHVVDLLRDSDNIYRKPFFILGHTQAPTSGYQDMHPADYKNYFLWHNGITKESTINGWDTFDILKGIVENGWDHLSTVDGTFSCVMYDGNKKKLYIFRNDLSPLYMNDEFEMSSTKFIKFKSTKPNFVFELDLHRNKFIKIAEFKTKENPYFFLDD